jgi:hyperosmotically inducible protein
MRYKSTKRSLYLAAATLLSAALGISGCTHRQFADEKASVNNSLNSNNLSNVSISQDRDKGVMTLTGNVGTADQKTQAENLAKQAAPDYTIANEIGVRPPGDQAQSAAVASNLDSGIEDNFKATIKAHKALDEQSIHGKARNGTLVLTGSVKTTAQKREAEKLAKSVPHVQEVVNELEVNPRKHSTSNS